MSSQEIKVITAVNKLRRDPEMQIWNPQQQALQSPDWKIWDRQFARIEHALRELGRAIIYGEHIIPEHTPISNQGVRGTCAANAWMDALEILMGLEQPNKVVQLSRIFAYWVGRVLTGHEKQDGGAYLRAVAHQIRKIGVVEESYLPYEDTLKAVLTPPALDMYTMASNNRIDSFYRISSAGQPMLDQIELAVRANHPVVSAAPVDQEFMDYRGGGQVFGPPAFTAGWHAMVIIGVRKVNGRRQFLRRNSWGKSWGDSGHAWCDEDYVLQDEDIWVGTRLAGLV